MKWNVFMGVLAILMVMPSVYAVSLTVTDFKCNDKVSLSIENGQNVNCFVRILNNDGANSASVNNIVLLVSGGWAEQETYSMAINTNIPASQSIDKTFEGIKSVTPGSNLKFTSVEIDGAPHTEEVSSVAINAMAIKSLSATTSSSSVAESEMFDVYSTVRAGGDFSTMELTLSITGCSLKSGESAAKSLGSMANNAEKSVSWKVVQGSSASCSITVDASGTTDTVTLTKSNSASVSNPNYVPPASSSGTGSSSGSSSGGGGVAVGPVLNGSIDTTGDEDGASSDAAGDDADKDVCAEVITPARNPDTGECMEFPTPCDVPEGWMRVDSCEKAADDGKPTEDLSGAVTAKTSFTPYYVAAVLILIAAAGIFVYRKRQV